MSVDSVLYRIRDQLNQELLVCAEKGNLTDFRKLLERGVDPKNCKGLNDFSPLHHAAARGHVHIVHDLLQLGLDVNIRNKDGETPLHLAVYNGYLLVTEQLIDNGADVNALNENEETPLMVASARGKHLVLRCLIMNGAQWELADNMGETAMDRAKDQKTKSMLSLLVSHGVDSAHSLSDVIGTLPYALLLRIFSFLPLRDISRCGCVNSKWHRVYQDDSLWQQRGVKRWEYVLRQTMGFSVPAVSMLSVKSLSGKSKAVTDSSARSGPVANQPAGGTSDQRSLGSRKNSRSTIVTSSSFDNNVNDMYF